MTIAVRTPNNQREMIRHRIARLPVDIYSTDEDLVVTASIPGVDPDTVEIMVEDQVLTINGEIPMLDEEVKFIFAERYHGPFSRSLKLNVPVNVDEIEAVFENGLLVITLPKAEEVRPKVIKVQAK